MTTKLKDINNQNIYDLIGVGFGPSNIALAIALQERYIDAGKQVNALFIEKQKTFAWHPNMLLSHADMQISFLKDLVTPRNPKSHYSFLNYLFEKQRLHDFINLKTFFPSRFEFNDYLTWLASHFEEQCQYGQEVMAVEPIFNDTNDNVEVLKVITKGYDDVENVFYTRSLVIGAGGRGYIPESFKNLKDDKRVFHSSEYLSSIANQDKPKQNNTRKVAIIGAGQSAAEIFLDLDADDSVEIDLITRAWAFKPSDDSPFVNEIFNPDFTDYIYNTTSERRDEIMTDYKSTNYAAPDLDVIKDIYDIFYQQKVTGNVRHNLLRRHEAITSQSTNDGISLEIKNLDTQAVNMHHYDTVILATGYARKTHEQLLSPLKEHINQFMVNRSYQIQTDDSFKPAIFLQGASEKTHGLSDTLLSILAVRSVEICEQLETQLPNFVN